MGEFEKFSEAARLYARHKDLIAEMKRILETEVDSFLDEVFAGIQEQLEGV